MDTQLAKHLIDQLDTEGYLQGLYFHLLGEPLLHPDILDIVEYAAQRIPYSTLFTNGSLLTPTIIPTLFERAPYVSISMQLIDEASFHLRGTAMTWRQYVSRIQHAIQYKVAHPSPSQVRIQVGVKDETAVFPHEDYFPQIAEQTLRENILQLFATLPEHDRTSIKATLDATTIPFTGNLEVRPTISLSIKPMGNWRRVYQEGSVERGYCPVVGKDLGILTNGDVVLCHLDYDGRTAFANVHDQPLHTILENPTLRDTLDQFRQEGIVPQCCQSCRVPTKFEQPL
jgi:sulfatase maturation enzyme AslB (radical SAM superfamily)